MSSRIPMITSVLKPPDILLIFLMVVRFPCYILNKQIPFLSAVGHSYRWPSFVSFHLM